MGNVVYASHDAKKEAGSSHPQTWVDPAGWPEGSTAKKPERSHTLKRATASH